MSLKPEVSASDHVLGSPSATIELVEYGDFQCPHCRQAHPIVKSIVQTFGSELRFVFRNFPLSKIHPQAREAAIAAEAAGAQGKFWQMHDILFEHQSNLAPGAIMRYAEQIGLDREQFSLGLTSAAAADKVDADFESGIRSGVNGTPSFFVNGLKYDGPWDEDSLAEYLEGTIRQKRDIPVQ